MGPERKVTTMENKSLLKTVKMDYYLKYFGACIEALQKYKIIFGIEIVISALVGITFVFPILAVLLFLNELLRLCVKISLWIVYGDKYELSRDPMGTNYKFMTPTQDRHTILYLGELEAPLHVESVKKNFQKYVIGNEVYRKLLTRVYENKWFYMCLRKCDNFDINNHVRIYPGTENRIVSEEELLKNILPNIAPDMKNLNHPQWELVIIPNYQPSSTNAEEDTQNSAPKALKIIRIHHSYMDGGSTLIMIANTFTNDGKSFPYVIDPCKPLKISTFSMILYKLTSLALFSSSMFSDIMNPPALTQSRFALKDPKSIGKTLFGWTNKISMEQFQRIKDKSGVSMPAIVTSVMAAAVRNLEEKYPEKSSGRKSQAEQPLWLVAGMFPYNSKKPGNNHLAIETTMDMSDMSGCERLTIMNDSLGRLAKNPKVTIYWWQAKLIGRTPTIIGKLFFKLGTCPIILSNIPLSTRNIKMWENHCFGIVGWVPLIFKTGLGCVTVRYADHFRYCITADSSVVNQEELDYFVTQLEHQVELLSWETSKLKRRISTDVSLFVREKEMKKSNLLSPPPAIIKEDDIFTSSQTNNNVTNKTANLEEEEKDDKDKLNARVSNNDSVDDGGEIVSRNNEQFSSTFISKVKDSIEQIKYGIKKIKEQ